MSSIGRSIQAMMAARTREGQPVRLHPAGNLCHRLRVAESAFLLRCVRAMQREKLFRWGCNGDGRPVVDADTTEARKLHAGMAQIESSDQPEEIELDALDPANFDA